MPSQTEAAEKPDSEEVFIELEIDGSLMDIMDNLAAELKQLAVPDLLDTQEEHEEIEQGIDLHLLPFPSASFREFVEYCLSGTYRATCKAHTLQLVVGDAIKAMIGLVSQSALAAVEHASKI
jgi:hypothetical protein